MAPCSALEKWRLDTAQEKLRLRELRKNDALHSLRTKKDKKITSYDPKLHFKVYWTISCYQYCRYYWSNQTVVCWIVDNEWPIWLVFSLWNSDLICAPYTETATGFAEVNIEGFEYVKLTVARGAADFRFVNGRCHSYAVIGNQAFQNGRCQSSLV